MNAPFFKARPFSFGYVRAQSYSDGVGVGDQTANPFATNAEQTQRWFIRDGNWRFSVDIMDSAGTGDPASSDYDDQEPSPDTQDTWAKRTAGGYSAGYGKSLDMTNNTGDPLANPFLVQFALVPDAPGYNTGTWYQAFQVTGNTYAHWDLTIGGGFPGEAYLTFTTIVPPAEVDSYIFYSTMHIDDQAGGTFDVNVYRQRAVPDDFPTYSYDQLYEMDMNLKPTTYLVA